MGLPERARGLKRRRAKTSENFAEETNVHRRKISEDFSEDRRYRLYRIKSDFRVFLDIFEVFTEDRFLLRSFWKLLFSGFLSLRSCFQAWNVEDPRGLDLFNLLSS